MVNVQYGKGDKKVMSIEGDMTIFNAQVILSSIDLSESKEIEIDLSNVTEIDTAGLQILLSIKKEALKNNLDVKFINISESIDNLLQLYRVKDYLIGVY